MNARTETPAPTEVISRKALQIRARAGNPCTTCPTCGREPNNPYRRINAGVITEGCVDATHTYAMECSATSNTRSWHFRKVAKEIRKMDLASVLKLASR